MGALSSLPPSKKLNQQDQIDNLLQEITDEVEIDSHTSDPAQDVENRLRKLRGEPESGGGGGGGIGGMSEQDEMNIMIDSALNWKSETDNEKGEQKAAEGEKKDGTKDGKDDD